MSACWILHIYPSNRQLLTHGFPPAENNSIDYDFRYGMREHVAGEFAVVKEEAVCMVRDGGNELGRLAGG